MAGGHPIAALPAANTWGRPSRRSHMEALGRSPAAHGRSPYEFHLEPPGGGGEFGRDHYVDYWLLVSLLAEGHR